MASSAKPTGTKRNSTQNTKPATIDLDAKEVKAEADTATAKTNAATKGQPFGGTKSDASTEAKTPAKENVAKIEKTSSKPEAKKAEASKATNNDATKTNKKPTSPAPNKPSGSFFSKLTSALMGGVAALVGFGAIGLWDGARELPIIGNFYGGSQSTSIDALKAEIEALKQANSVPTVDLAPINEKIASFETSLKAVSDSASNGTALSEKVAKIDQDLTAVNTSIAEITASAADGSNSSPAALSTAISSLDKRIEGLEGQIGSITKSVTALTQSAETNTQNLVGLTKQSSTLVDTVATVKANEKIARSVAVNSLSTALVNDNALSLPIASIKALVGETPETNRLETLNAQGIASRKDLITSLADFTATIQNPNAPPKEGSIADRFWANAQNMVAFRASGPREGDDPLAILSRVKANVESDNLSTAKAEWEKLPAEVSEKGASWLAKLNSRLEAFGIQKALNQKLTAEAG